MRLYAALVVCSACGFQPRAAIGDATPGSDAAFDAPPDASDDIDGDGVPNAVDNCPAIANPDQRDHDVDGRGDVCDLCPHIAEPSDTDSDGDGVGDACDPRPSTPGDRRALWVGFYDANDIAGWLVNGTDSVSLGRLVIGTTTTTLQYTFPNQIFTNAYAVAGVRALAVGTLQSGPVIEMQNGNNAVDHAYICYIVASTGGTSVFADDFWPGQMSQTVGVPWSGTFAANSDFVITDKLVASTHSCSIKQGIAAAMPVETAGPDPGYVILGAQYATAGFDYLFVVEMGQ